MRIISLHSFRPATGKTTIVASLAALIAQQGRRVGVIDADLEAPSLHFLFGIDPAAIACSLNEYLNGDCEIESAAVNISQQLQATLPGEGYFVPANPSIMAAQPDLDPVENMERLQAGYRRLGKLLNLDLLLVDTAAGLGQGSMIPLAASDLIVILLKLDNQDYQGTAVLTALAEKLDTAQIVLLVNRMPDHYAIDQVYHEASQAYNTPVMAVLPYDEQVLSLGSSGVFACDLPTNALTLILREVAAQIAAM